MQYQNTPVTHGQWNPELNMEWFALHPMPSGTWDPKVITKVACYTPCHCSHKASLQ